MAYIPPRLRREVTERANKRCEYCRGGQEKRVSDEVNTERGPEYS